MPRKLAQEKLKLLNDKDWLYNLHVVEKFSIVEIAKNILQVTPATVRKHIRRHNIKSPTQQELREASNIRKYGVPNPGMVQEFRSKALETMVKKFGGHVWSTDGNRESRDATCLALYGDTNVGRTEYAKSKAKQTNLERYGREHKNQTHISSDVYDNINSIDWLWDQHNNKKRSLSDIANECNVDMSILMNRLQRYHLETQNFFHSTGEREVLSFIKELLPSEEVISNTRSVISPMELDIYVPSRKIAIEYCGLYWHSEQQGKTKWYHHSKWEQCHQQGIQLITIFEDEWNYRREQVKDKLKHLLGLDDRDKVFARKCTIVVVDTDTKQVFFNSNHIQGDGPSSINIGLEHGGELVACMGLISQNDCYYLNRFATSSRVVGGFSKLLKYFINNYPKKKIISFSDLRWSDGGLYYKSGWQLDQILHPDYTYVHKGLRVHKFNYRRKNLPNLLEHFDPDLSEKENCDRAGVLRVWDCGKMRFVY